MKTELLHLLHRMFVLTAALLANLAQACVPPAPGLIAWWRAETDARDFANTNHGTLVNGATFAPGQVGSAFQTGAGYVRVPDAPELQPTQVTVSAWVSISGPPPAYSYVLSKSFDVQGGSYAMYAGGDPAPGGLVFYITHPGLRYVFAPVAGTNLWDNRFHHVAGSYDGQFIRLYVDGVEVGNGTSDSDPIGYDNYHQNGDLLIGSYYTDLSVTRWPGLIDEVAIFNRALSSNEIAAIYAAGSAGMCPNLVWIPPGTFTMGSPPSEAGLPFYSNAVPPHPVTLTRGFWMGRYEVTQGEYGSLMNANPSAFRGDDRRPVEQVSWFDATEYCRRLTDAERAAGRLPSGYIYRLPTEAEWEYACRAGSTTRWSFGDNVADLSSHAWFYSNSGCNPLTNDCSNGSTRPVGLKLPNPWGLYDMHGNVLEYVQDWYNPYSSAAATDPMGPSTGTQRVNRGGGWDFGDILTRSSVRYSYPPSWSDNSIGFRVVLAPQLAPSPDLVWIPPGTFTMGSPPSEAGLPLYSNAVPPHPVTLTRGFWMSRHEVTQGEYTSLMNANPSAFRGDDRRPVEQVSWFDATEYCRRLTDAERVAGRLPDGFAYRLPTEAEWEYACRAGTVTRFSFGDNRLDLSNYGWHIGNSGCQYTNDPQCLTTGTTHPVGTKLPNPWGLYDMHGNVGEWVLDWYNPYSSVATTDPMGPSTGTQRIYRGPGWDFGDVHSRSSSRWNWEPHNRDNSVGFRVVLAPEALRVTLFATGFEAPEGYVAGQPLIGQQGWVRGSWAGQIPSGGQGVATNLVPDSPQQAFIGGQPGATNPAVYVGITRSLYFQPEMNAPGPLQFSWVQLITDSTNGARNYFEWLFYNQQGQLLGGLFFAGDTGVILRRRADNSLHGTGHTFALGQLCAMTVSLDFLQNSWSASIGTNVLFSEPIANAQALNLGSFAVTWWDSRATAIAGDNRMIFDDLRVTAPAPDPLSPVVNISSITNAWRYWQNGPPPATNWFAAEFSDAAWPAGPGVFFSETNTLPAPKLTPLTLGQTAYYFRTRFNLASNVPVTGLTLRALVDDGAVFYLNGEEAARLRMPLPPAAINHGTLATAQPPGGDALAFETLTIPASQLGALRPGENVLAVEVHQQSATSSDIVFGAAVEVGVAVPSGVPPLVVVHPQPVTATAGSNATFSVAAASTAPLTFQWRRNGADLSGETNATLRLTNVQPAVEGRYDVVVSNAYGAIISDAAQLTVVVRPFFITQPAPQTNVVVEGGSATFAVRAGGTLPLTFRWRRGGAVFTNITLFTNFCVLTLSNVQITTSSNISLNVTNLAGSTLTLSSNAWLYVMRDADGDGLGDEWELANGLNPGSALDLSLDSDGDGLSNAEEFLAGTNPTNAASTLELESSVAVETNRVVLTFEAMPHKSYVLECVESVSIGANWQTVTVIAPTSQPRTVTVTNELGTARQRFYRLRTPAWP